jgi:hypothetical protein
MTRAGALAALLLAAAALPAAAQDRPGDRQYAVLTDHLPVAFDRALRTGADLIDRGQVKAFELLLTGRGLILAIPGSTNAQRGVVDLLRRHRGLRIVACKETVDALAAAARHRPQLLPGTVVEPCIGRLRKMDAAGWQRVPGL